MASRIRRAAARAITPRTALLLLAGPVLGALQRVREIVETVEWWHQKIMVWSPHLAFPTALLLSPYFPAVLTVAAVGVLFWRAWPVKLSARAQSFIELLEERISLGKKLLASRQSVTMIEWKTWEEQTILDLARCLTPHSHYLLLFRSTGNLTTHEYGLGEEGIKKAIGRQIRALREMIDETDEGKVQQESSHVSSETN
jgi:hypothetical protein